MAEALERRASVGAPVIQVVVLDHVYPLEEFSLQAIPREDLQLISRWELGGITDPMGQLVNWLWTQISGALEALKSALISAISSAVDTVSRTVSQLISDVLSALDSVYNMLKAFIEDGFNTITSTLSSITSTLTSIANSITSAVTTITTTISSSFDTLLSSLSSAIASLGAQLQTYISSAISTVTGAISQGFSSLTDLVSSVFNTLSSQLQGLVSAVESAITSIVEGVSSAVEGALTSVVNAISSAFSQLQTSLMSTFATMQEFFGNVLSTIMSAINEVRMTLAGFVNPLVQIANVVTNLPSVLGEALTSAVGYVISKASELLSGLWPGVVWLAGKLWEGLTWIGSLIWEGVVALGNAIKSGVENVVRGLYELASGVGGFLYDLLLKPVADALDSMASEILKLYGIGSPEVPFSRLVIAGAPLLALRMATGFVSEMSEGIADTEVEILGTKVTLGLAKVLKSLDVRGLIEGIYEGFMTGLAMAYFSATVLEPTRIETLRSVRPYAIDIEEGREALRRGLITLKDLDEIMARHGVDARYLDVVTALAWKIPGETMMELMLGKYSKATPQGEVQIEDWVKKATITLIQAQGYRGDLVPEDLKDYYEKLVEAKLYEMAVKPSVSDIIRFAVKEVFENLEAQYSQIKESAPQAYLRFSELKGLGEYWALAYWDEHWRLIPPERVHDLYLRGVLTKEQYLKYIRWHDYRPVARPGMPKPDTELMLEALWEIPLRIDARWMARWGIIDVKEMARIVVMRGLHPDWIGKVVSAEWVNNLLDERNRLVSTLLSGLEEGFLTFEEFKKIVEEYEIQAYPETITVKGAGGETTTLRLVRKIRLLNEDEVRLNELRVGYRIDFAKRKLMLDALELLYVAGRISDQELSRALEQIVKNEGLRDKWLTRIKARRIREQLYYAHRQLLRTVDAICTLYEEGFISRDKAFNEIKAVAGRYLDDVSIELILKESDYRIARSIKRALRDAILSRLRRGAISVQEAKRLLKELGLPESLVEALVERYAKIYVPSIDRLITISEYVAVPEDLIKRKIEQFGVPSDEAQLLLMYAKVRPLADELRAYLRELERDYVEGLVTEDELKREYEALKAIGFLTDTEIKLRLEIAKRRKRRYELRRGRAS